MSRLQVILAVVAGALAALALLLAIMSNTAPLLLLFLGLGALSLVRFVLPLPFWLDGGLALLGAVALLTGLPAEGVAALPFWLALIATWAFCWLFVERPIMRRTKRATPSAAPVAAASQARN